MIFSSLCLFKDVNVFGSIRLNSAALPLLRRWNGLDDENSTQEFPEKTSSSNKKKKHQIPSRVIFISSGSGLLGAPFSAVYSSSKFALEGLADAFRAEVFPQNIHVSVINPGTGTVAWRRIDAFLFVLSAE